MENSVIRDGEAWKHFDQTYPSFAIEPRNVRLALSTDGFNPHNQGSRPYSCWPVIVTPYNLPPWMCMDRPYMFLTLLVPGPKSPGRSLDVYLQPLIDELNILWNVGVETYDVSKKQNFQMKAALMWTISDFPAYGMLSGWSTHGKTKDNVKARLDLQDICKRRNLELKEMNGKYLKPKASYTLSKDERAIVLKWIKDLRLPDGYASNLGRSVNLDDFSMYGMKSHDCHVFMEKLLPIAFRDLLPESVWNALTELSLFFRDLCSIVLLESNVKTLEENIIVTLCKLEKIFPPSFFDSMEHLPIHLAYEARCGGPIQYRWMYPFERRYDAEKYAELPDLTPKALGVMRDKEFASWFFNYVENPTNGVTETDIRLFSRGFSSIVKRWNGYFVNGYRFHTLEYGETNSTMNSGVCISGVTMMMPA
ncbi:UNVERIFIED_CONTAM: hypothetical protein Sradi_3822200 [Sesamum radiatum]|uniref:DUF4218 domain-containing protein n=1 Tax=Sesamum radiatum TaxID=300843 RepID=A0AAW2Q0X4_SESRA